MFVEKVGVVGAGTMGAAIAEVMALNGKHVILKDVKQEYVDAGMKRVEGILDELVTFHAGKAAAEIERIERLGVTLTDEQRTTIEEARKPTYTRERADQVMERIEPTTDYAAFEDVDVVIEAVLEDIPLKQKVFAELEEATPRHTVLATNTSVLSVTEIAAGTKDRRAKTLGWHFFNPPHTLPLVEVIPGYETHQSVVEESVQFLEELRNHRYPMLPVVVQEGPGFVVNRVLSRAMNEAFLIHEEGLAQPRDIDKAIKAGLGWPMGPFELADLVGIDVIHHVGEGMKALGFPEHQRASQLARQLYASGRLGKKSGRGFYDYSTSTDF